MSNAQSDVVAAVGISNPSERLTQKCIGELVPHVIEAASRISRTPGFTGDTAAEMG